MDAGQQGPGARANVMVALDVVGLVSCLAAAVMFGAQLPTEVLMLISSIASVFGLNLRDAHQFEFGSSRGSRSKDALLAQRSAPPDPLQAGPAAP